MEVSGNPQPNLETKPISLAGETFIGGYNVDLHQRLTALGLSDILISRFLEEFSGREIQLVDSRGYEHADEAVSVILANRTPHSNIVYLAVLNGIGITVSDENGDPNVGVFTPDQGMYNCSFYHARIGAMGRSQVYGNFQKADLKESEVTSPVLYLTTFRDADLRGAHFDNQVILRCDFTNALVDEHTTGIPAYYMEQTVRSRRWDWLRNVFTNSVS